MKQLHYLILLLLFFFSLFLSAGPLKAQNEKFSKDYYQDFLQDYRQYQGLIEPFNIKKSREEAYNSVATEAEFLEASKTLILAEIKAITSYTSFLKAYLAEATQIINYQENYLYIKLDDELAFLREAKEKVGSLSSLTAAQTLLTNLSGHYEKVNRINYQIKSIVEVGSAQKTLVNLNVEREKIGSFLSDSQTENARVMAAREKNLSLEKEVMATDELLKKAGGMIKTDNDSNAKVLGVEIRKLVDEAVGKMVGVVSGYKNIVFSLK